MIAFIRGKLHTLKGDNVIVDVNGLGYVVQVPLSALALLPSLGQEIMLHTYMAVREDGMSLYGFDTVEALDVFSRLLNVSGVGPRGALSLLSAITPRNLVAAVKEENIALLTRAPGIGKKTAQRIILELKDKFKFEDYPAGPVAMPEGRGGIADDAVEALVALGYSMSQAVLAVERARKEAGPEVSTSELVRHALRQLMDARGTR
ncbi:MAG: Holliday junction branch migration protein RuvA [Desulfocucumaceae bacterium]